MNTEIHTMFQPLIASTGAQNSSTVTSESGIAAYCIKGMRLPRLLVLRSDRDAINGSVTASNTRDSAVKLHGAAVDVVLRRQIKGDEPGADDTAER